MIRDFKDLKVWKTGMEIVDLIYEFTAKFQEIEKYVLITQMRRAAISIPSNISEGHSPEYTKVYKRYLNTSLGSCAELETQTIVAKRREYFNESDYGKLMELLNHERRMLINLLKKLN